MFTLCIWCVLYLLKALININARLYLAQFLPFHALAPHMSQCAAKGSGCYVYGVLLPFATRSSAIMHGNQTERNTDARRPPEGSDQKTSCYCETLWSCTLQTFLMSFGP